MDLSIIVPGIRPHLWQAMYDSVAASIGSYTWEMIFVGPCGDLIWDTLPNARFIKDYGCPSRCTQLGTTVANGDLFTWASDDGLFIPNGLSEAIRLYNTLPSTFTQIVMRYYEGLNKTGKQDNNQPMEYWTAHFHPTLRLSTIKPRWLTAPLGMMNTHLFRQLGGFDTRFEHINMCCHDLSFRIQYHGGTLHLSPEAILDCDFSLISDPKSGAILSGTYLENDLPLFNQIYSQDPNRKVDYDNWMQANPVWPRRFKVEAL